MKAPALKPFGKMLANVVSETARRGGSIIARRLPGAHPWTPRKGGGEGKRASKRLIT